MSFPGREEVINPTLKNKGFKNNNTSPIHPPHHLNTLPTKRSEAERVGSGIVNTKTLSVSLVFSFIYPTSFVLLFISQERCLIPFNER